MALPPLEGGQRTGDGRDASGSTVQPSAGLKPLGEPSFAPRWQSGSVNFNPARERQLEPPARERGCHEILQSRELPRLETLGNRRELPQIDPKAELPLPVGCRNLTQFGSRSRVAPAKASGARLAPIQHDSLPAPGTRLAPLQHDRLPGLPLDTNAPMQSLRPTCPWMRSAVNYSEDDALDHDLESCANEDFTVLAPEVLIEEDVGRCDVVRCEQSPEDEIAGIERLDRSTCGSSARAEVERAVHTAFLEECGRGSSPTAAAVEAILRCRSSLSRGSSFHKESHRLLLKEGEDSMGITA